MEINGFEVVFCETTIEELLTTVQGEGQKMLFTCIIKCGGAMVHFLSQETIDKNLQSDLITEEGRKELSMITPRYEIVFIKDMTDCLSTEEKDAMFHHELGHLVYGHVEEAEKHAGGDIFNVLEYEIEADAYSAFHTGAVHVI